MANGTGLLFGVPRHAGAAPPILSDVRNDLILTFNNCGTTSNLDFRYMRIGPLLKGWGVITLGTPATAVLSIQLPAGLSIDYSSITKQTQVQTVGLCYRLNTSASYAGSSYGPFPIFIDGSTTSLLFPTNSGTATNLLQKRNADNIYSVSGELLSFEFSIPILGWSLGT